VDILLGVYFELRVGEVRIFGLYNNKLTNKQTNKAYVYDLKSKVQYASALNQSHTKKCDRQGLAVWLHRNNKKSQYCVSMDVCFVLFFCCLPICVCICPQVQGPLRECLSIRSGFCGLPLYCAPLVCVPAVIGVLVVRWHNKSKTKNQGPSDFDSWRY